MGFKLDENIFDYLNSHDLDTVEEDFSYDFNRKNFKFEEDLDQRINGDMILYEDEDFSKTPAEADDYRSTTEDILGFNLDGNQVQYLATEWPAFYHDAKKYSSMKDQIIQFMSDEGLVSDDQLEQSSINSVKFDDDEDDIDYYEDYNQDALHPQQSDMSYKQQNKGFTPLQVQSWDDQNYGLQTQQQDQNLTGNQQMSQIGDEMIYDDYDVDDDFSIKNSPEEINKILMGTTRKEENQLL